MYQQRYDVIVVGESLASRIASALLAKQGRRVLTFQNSEASLSSWLNSSLHLERLLETLGGQSCYTSPTPFQVLTPEIRIEINGKMPLEDELRRELPECHREAVSLLGSLATGGLRLEELLWKNASSLFSWGGRALFALRQKFARVGLGSLNRPLGEWIDARIDNAQAREALKCLFAGLSMTPTKNLSVAEAALVWHSATRSSGISGSGLDDLLRHRYEQFHGESEDIKVLKGLVTGKNRVEGVVLKQGGNCTAETILFADDFALSLLPEQIFATPPSAVQRLLSTPLGNTISPLLTKRMIVGGEPPLRLTLGKHKGETICAIDFPTGPETDEDPTQNLANRLQPIFPFVDLSFSPAEKGDLPHIRSGRGKLFGQTGPLRLARNALLCSGAVALPGLGGCGESILGMAVAKRYNGKKG